LVLLLGVLPQLLVAILAPALVACEESDGAKNFELRVAGCCVTDGQSAQTQQVRSQDTDCGGCEDAVVSLSLKQEDGQPPNLPESVLLTTVTDFGRSWDGFAPYSRAPPSSLPPNPSLAALRTVNLRC